MTPCSHKCCRSRNPSDFMASERSQRLVSTALQIMLRGLPILLMGIVCGITFLLVQVNTP